MLKLINSIQLTSMFAAAPFGIGWLATQTFPYHTAAMVVPCVAYLVSFGFMVAAGFFGLITTE